jgi:hypothetical protein
MNNSVVEFKIIGLEAQVAEPITVCWGGREIDPGPITIELDEASSPTANQGALDYGRGQARAEFHVLLSFPEFAETLESLGVAKEFTKPIRAIIRSQGKILDDHSFALSGSCDVGPHVLFPPEETRASVLPGV